MSRGMFRRSMCEVKTWRDGRVCGNVDLGSTTVSISKC